MLEAKTASLMIAIKAGASNGVFIKSRLSKMSQQGRK